MREETRQSLTLLWGTGATGLLGLAFSALTARWLGPAPYGEVAAAVALVLAGQTALGPINGTVARFAAEYMVRRELGKVRTLYREVGRRVGVYGALSLAVAALLSPLVATALHYTSYLPVIMAFATVYLMLLLSVARGILRGVQGFGQYNANTIVEGTSRLGLGAALLWLAPTVTAALAGYALAPLVALGFADFQVRSHWRGLEPRPISGGAVRRFVRPMLLLMLTTAGFAHLDMLFVKRFFDATEAGEYGAATMITRTLAVAATPFQLMLLPLLTVRHGRGESVLTPLVRTLALFLATTAVPVALFWLFPEPIIRLLCGPGFSGAAPYLGPLAVARLCGHIAHLLALAGASTNRFGFLYVYLLGLAGEAALIAVVHGSISAVVSIVLAVHVATLALLLAISIPRAARPSDAVPPEGVLP